MVCGMTAMFLLVYEVPTLVADPLSVCTVMWIYFMAVFRFYLPVAPLQSTNHVEVVVVG
jgi:hypothetical protein